MENLSTGYYLKLWVKQFPYFHQNFPRKLILVSDAADVQGLKVALHIEPYTGRNAESLRKNLKYVLSTHGKHPAFYKRKWKNKLLPVYYVYDSYR